MGKKEKTEHMMGKIFKNFKTIFSSLNMKILGWINERMLKTTEKCFLLITNFLVRRSPIYMPHLNLSTANQYTCI